MARGFGPPCPFRVSGPRSCFGWLPGPSHAPRASLCFLCPPSRLAVTCSCWVSPRAPDPDPKSKKEERENTRLSTLEEWQFEGRRRKKTTTTTSTTTAMMTTRVQADQKQENDSGSEHARAVFGATLALKTLFGDTALWL